MRAVGRGAAAKYPTITRRAYRGFLGELAAGQVVAVVDAEEGSSLPPDGTAVCTVHRIRDVTNGIVTLTDDGARGVGRLLAGYHSYSATTGRAMRHQLGRHGTGSRFLHPVNSAAIDKRVMADSLGRLLAFEDEHDELAPRREAALSHPAGRVLYRSAG